MDGIGRKGDGSGSAAADAGRRIPGYDNLMPIGSGGSSTVYRAVDVRHQRPVAVKVLDVEAAGGPRRTAFQREVEAIGRVGSHPYIVTVLGSGFTLDDRPYLVLPLFERGTYSRLVDENGPLTWADAVDIGIKLCSAVETVHRAGVVHRDIKPGNIFIGVTPEHPLLADFGISSTIDGERTRTQTMAVTFGYTAPEVLDDERPTPASDLYSLSMTIFRLIQGLHAYHADTPAAVVRKMMAEPDSPQLSAGVPAAVAAVVADGLARDPVNRPPSALAMARRLQQVQLGHGLPATPVIVADEPSVADHPPSAEDPQTTTASVSSRADVEDAVVGVARRRGRPERASPRQADAGRLLATAISKTAPQPSPTDQPSTTAAAVAGMEPGRDQSLDLPTVVTPRRARNDRIDDEAEVDGAAGRQGRRRILLAGLAVAVLIVLALVLAITTRSDGFELYPGSDDFSGN